MLVLSIEKREEINIRAFVAERKKRKEILILKSSNQKPRK